MSPIARPGSARLAPGDVVRSRELTTIEGARLPVPGRGVVTHLQFRRFAGCPVCNVHLRSIANRCDEIVAAGVREIAVFHSPAEIMLPLQGGLPFDTVADPGKRLYAEFGVEASPRSVLHPKVWASMVDPRAWSFVARGRRAGADIGPADGEGMLGLPADILIDPDGTVRAAKYGRHAVDHWSVDELLRLVRAPGAGSGEV